MGVQGGIKKSREGKGLGDRDQNKEQSSGTAHAIGSIQWARDEFAFGEMGSSDISL